MNQLRIDSGLHRGCMFLRMHWNSLFATEFSTVEVWTHKGVITFYVMAVMHLKERRIHIAGITTRPNATWMKQVCRNLSSIVDCSSNFMNQLQHCIVPDVDGMLIGH